MIEKTRITIVFVVFMVLLLWTGIGHCSNWVVVGEDNERYIYADYDSISFYVQDGDRNVSLWFKFVPKDKNFPYYAMEFINAREKNLNFIVHDIRFYDARTGQIVKSGYGNEEGWQKSEGTIYRSVFSSIFSSTKQKHKGASGTGFFITPAHLVTNYHVVEGGTQFEILFRDNRYTAELFATDPNNDLAILKVSGLEGDIKPLLIANSRDVKEGTKVYTVGFPMPGQLGLRAKLSDGIINAISGYQDDMRLFQISIPVQPGNSGGPLLNNKGEVIGVVTSGLGIKFLYKTGVLAQNVNYALKSSNIINLSNNYQFDLNISNLSEELDAVKIMDICRDAVVYIEVK